MTVTVGMIWESERQLADSGHAWSPSCIGVDDVIDHRAPVVQVCRSLVHHLLTKGVIGVALVGVVEDQLAGVCQHEAFSGWLVLVLGEGVAASCD